MTAINTVSDLRDRYGFDDSNTALNSALAVVANSAKTAMSVLMRTEFDAVTAQSDIFSPRAMIRNGELFEVKFKLSQGFVNSVSVNYASSIADLTSNPQSIPTFFLDSDKGVVTVYDIDFTSGWAFDFRRLVPGLTRVGPGIYVQITYNAGFPAADGVYTGTPDWLVEAAAARALVDLDENYSAYRGDRAASPPDLMRRKDRIAQNLVRRIRYVPNAEMPIGT